MSCPKCDGTHIIYGGFFYRKDGKKQRYKCYDCGKSFIVKTIGYRNKIPFRIRKKILRLYKTRKGYIGQFDSHKKGTYSTREIAKIVGVSKSVVWSIIQKRRLQRKSKSQKTIL
jgi:transposase-like protein